MCRTGHSLSPAFTSAVIEITNMDCYRRSKHTSLHGTSAYHQRGPDIASGPLLLLLLQRLGHTDENNKTTANANYLNKLN